MTPITLMALLKPRPTFPAADSGCFVSNESASDLDPAITIFRMICVDFLPCFFLNLFD